MVTKQTHPHTPATIAKTIAVDVATVHRWSKSFASALSDGASPAQGGQRRYNDSDLAVLAEVARLRGEGQSTAAIANHLAGIVFSTASPATIITEPTTTPTVAPSVAPGALAMLEALASIEPRLQALERQRVKLDIVFVAVVAFLAGLLVAALIFWFL